MCQKPCQKNCTVPHTFSMDNIDWKRKTLEGGMLNVTTKIIIENQGIKRTAVEGGRVTTSTTYRRKTQSYVAEPSHHSVTNQQNTDNSRSLGHIKKLESLETSSDGLAKEPLLVWHLWRIVPNLQFLDAPTDSEASLAVFSAFCANVHPRRQASIIGYPPLIPASPTDPSVIKKNR